MLTLKDITIQRGDKMLLQNVSGFIGAKEKVGLVGVNGSGKSTLLKCIVGESALDTGKIELKGSYAYLAQETYKERLDSEVENLSVNHDLTIEEYLVLKGEIDVEPWEISKMLNLINMKDKAPDSKISELSGGQKVKVDIIKLLLIKPELLILDEPTNFLDIPAAEWLMGYLSEYENSVLVVSHDLRLMNRGITKIWYLNDATNKIESFNGNYTKFLEMKERQEEWLVKQIKKEERTFQKMLKTAAVLASRTTTKEKMRAAKLRERAEEKSRETNEKIAEMRKLIVNPKGMKLKFTIRTQPGKKVLEVNSLAKSYTHPVLRNISLELFRGEKMVVIGRNGIGKSTLLKILVGQIPADSGKFQWGHNVDIGYYAQEYEGLDYEKSILENLLSDPLFQPMGEQVLRKILGGFLFSGDKINQTVGTLSGGEKTRLAMSKIIAGGYNTLLLDEPTTYLDPHSQKILLEELKRYRGTVILVSHEPDFVRQLNPDKALLMPEEKFTHFSPSLIERVAEI